MTLSIPPTTYKTRLLIIIAGITVLFWSGLEDNQIWGVTLLGWLLGILSVFTFLQSQFENKEYHIITLLKFSPIIGGIVGASASLLTLLLMLFKNIRHAHVFPDYPPQLMLAMLDRLPIWSISSGLILFGITLLLYVIYSDKGSPTQADSATIESA